MTTLEQLMIVLAEQEHQQWIEWTRGLVEWMRDISRYGNGEVYSDEDKQTLLAASDILIKKWKPKWVPYEQLSQELKDSDIRFAKRPLQAFQEHVLEVMKLT